MDPTLSREHRERATRGNSAASPRWTGGRGWEGDTGTYLLLAHPVPGSITVAVGDEVTEGQVLGKCGNSGNTSEPHVHVHHQRQLPEQIGFGEGLPLYFRDHDGPPMPTGGFEMDGDVMKAVGARVRHVGR